MRYESPLLSIPDYDGIGIYAIINQSNNRMYIGSAKNVNARLQTHKRDMRNLRCNKKIEADIKKGHHFVAIVLEEVKENLAQNELLTKERRFSETFNSVRQGYNHMFVNNSIRGGDKIIERVGGGSNDANTRVCRNGCG